MKMNIFYIAVYYLRPVSANRCRQNLNLVISRCSLEENGKEMH